MRIVCEVRFEESRGIMCYVLKVTQDVQLNGMLDQLFLKYFVNVIQLPDAINAQEALAVAKNHSPEILLIDLNLQDDNPHDIIRQVKTRHPNVRCIFFDQEENFKNIQYAMRSGAIDYLVKPLIEEEALTSIHRAIISLNQVSLLNHRVNGVKTTANETILPMIEYIHENYQTELNLDKLADFMHLNKTYLCQLFKKEVGMTYIAYLTEYRVEQAKKLLRETSDSLAEISELIGYADPAYFSRIFKKYEGISPNQYRQTYKGDYVGATFYGNT